MSLEGSMLLEKMADSVVSAKMLMDSIALNLPTQRE